ncbi:MAG: isopentenyl-diphosphate Delta-isomerase [Chitinophagaceae bacterium]|jgi:isopentenyl-diphosphate Delta-isomerase|nr:isopentenyl-diphosphate Delta-isomerase [Chitinophagaceae bacterium]
MHEVILVNEQDEVTGSMEKMEAHEKALLHRAFSIFLFNKNGQMLLQKRAATKYHSPSLWTNACCSHPAPGETTEQAALRRLKEELGITAQLTKAFHFTYKAAFDNGLTEHEFDHVFIGEYDGELFLNEEEVSEVDYKPMAVIKEEIQYQSALYTEWFKIAFPLLEQWLNNKLKTNETA